MDADIVYLFTLHLLGWRPRLLPHYSNHNNNAHSLRWLEFINNQILRHTPCLSLNLGAMWIQEVEHHSRTVEQYLCDLIQSLTWVHLRSMIHKHGILDIGNHAGVQVPRFDTTPAWLLHHSPCNLNKPQLRAIVAVHHNHVITFPRIMALSSGELSLEIECQISSRLR